MDIEEIREYCLTKRAVTEELPFDDVTLVFKVKGKIFALMSLESNQLSVNLKCDPSRSIELREQYPAVMPGYHMNKKHWNTVVMDGTLPGQLVRELIDHSYELVTGGLNRRLREELRE